jgi:SSS family solute:Na+ symporter
VIAAAGSINWSQMSVFIVLFVLVTVIGFVAARWRRGDLGILDEWGLAGRRFGSIVTWFLLGGDLYTAYTFIAVPALVFGSGAVGLFAIPYTILVYPIVFVTMPKLWQVARNRGYVTGADFVRDRFDSRTLALLITITGMVATMPYIALQIFGIKVVVEQMGANAEAAIITAFVVLAAFTFVSGLRAPALIALVKDTIIWITVLVAVIYIPIKLGGYGAVFAQKAVLAKANLPYAGWANYATLAFGSALALFLYPHALTGVFAAKSQGVVRRNAAFLPAYSFMLGLMALLGYMALAAAIKPAHEGTNGAVPALLDSFFAGPVAGFAFGAIAIGALVPAAVMSIAAANLFSRNIWRVYIRPKASPREEANVSKVASLVVKAGALAYILAAPTTNIIEFQLAGGVLILQTLPSLLMGLFWAWLDRWALIVGWIVGMGTGVFWLAEEHFTKTSHIFNPFGSKYPMYIGLVSVALNVIVVLLGTALSHAIGAHRRSALISESDFHIAPA